MDTQGTAEAFVRALDTEDFDATEAILAPSCVYQFRGAETLGGAKIVASYRAAAEWASESFDRIRYESSLQQETPTRFRVRFIDLTEHGGRSHRHECEQVFTVDADGRIDSIEHIDLPGERERLRAFLDGVGVKPRS